MILKIVFCHELPGWIRSSTKAAYHPPSNSIFIAKKEQSYFKIITHLFHELVHFVGHQLGGPEHWLHRIIDGGKVNYI